MPKIKEFTVSSKRSVQIKGEFYTFECSELVTLEDEDVYKEEKQNAWDRVNTEVDNQVLDVARM